MPEDNTVCNIPMYTLQHIRCCMKMYGITFICDYIVKERDIFLVV